MKYIKTCENLNKAEKVVAAKEYFNKVFKNFKVKYYYNNIHEDIKYLKKSNINFQIYYYNDTKFGIGLYFKILVKDNLTLLQSGTLRYLDFNFLEEDYEFTFDWTPIEEDEINIIISSDKYNI